MGVPDRAPRQVLLFLFLSCAGLFLLFQVSVGLDQELALPEVGTHRGQCGPAGTSGGLDPMGRLGDTWG